ncbi:cell division protein FtsQ/DivIB [Gammaproteobacteria bacterium]|nr:cell division protein FtsQ/DivIB [Gammaproteobacteria bacterium]
MRAERKAGVVVGAVRAGAHAVRKSKVVDSAPARSSAPLRYIVTLSVLIATLAFVALDTFAVHRAELVGFFSKPISKVRIENQWQRVSESDVTGILQQYIGAGFFDFDINGASRDLEALPWVASVDLRRLWPDTLSLHLREEVPIAKWGAVELLNQYGELFSPTDTDDFAGLPLLEGPADSQDQVMQQYKQLSQALSPAGLKLDGLKLSHRQSWSLKVNAMQIEAGRQDVLARTQRFARFYAQQDRAETAQFASVDLRYGNGIAVKKRALKLAPLSDVAQR